MAATKLTTDKKPTPFIEVAVSPSHPLVRLFSSIFSCAVLKNETARKADKNLSRWSAEKLLPKHLTNIFLLLFLRVQLDFKSSAQSGIDAEFRQNHELQKQPNDSKPDYPI